MPKVIFVNEKKEIEVESGANLRTAARANGIDIYKGLSRYLNCRGLGMCGTCRVFVKSGMENLTPRSVMERINLTVHPMTMMAAIGHETELRLACQTCVKGDCTIETHADVNWNGENFWQKPYPNK
jgi:ferredoxin